MFDRPLEHFVDAPREPLERRLNALGFARQVARNRLRAARERPGADVAEPLREPSGDALGESSGHAP